MSALQIEPGKITIGEGANALVILEDDYIVFNPDLFSATDRDEYKILAID